VTRLISGSYHNFALSQNPPSQIEPEITPQAEAIANQQLVQAGHREEDCPNADAVKKLKGEVKRLRQELILNPKKR